MFFEQIILDALYCDFYRFDCQVCWICVVSTLPHETFVCKNCLTNIPFINNWPCINPFHFIDLGQLTTVNGFILMV